MKKAIWGSVGEIKTLLTGFFSKNEENASSDQAQAQAQA
jgi:hypothetical protein